MSDESEDDRSNGSELKTTKPDCSLVTFSDGSYNGETGQSKDYACLRMALAQLPKGFCHRSDYAPYKESNKGTLAQRARQLGLECIALKILDGTTEISLRMIDNLVNPYVEDLKTVHKVEQAELGALVPISAADNYLPLMLIFTRKRIEPELMVMDNMLVASSVKNEKIEFSLETKERGNSKNASENSQKNIAEKSKYERYFNFKTSFSRIRSHQPLLYMLEGEINNGFDYNSIPLGVPTKVPISRMAGSSNNSSPSARCPPHPQWLASFTPLVITTLTSQAYMSCDNLEIDHICGVLNDAQLEVKERMQEAKKKVRDEDTSITKVYSDIFVQDLHYPMQPFERSSSVNKECLVGNLYYDSLIVKRYLPHEVIKKKGDDMVEQKSERSSGGEE
uniref:Uncharacterized protein n=1 Tax=Timema tahoe TaxID=61484 RepID=A0A7R9IRH2_9NEOP|nr:unnamed protein product [Timema tahoe]